MLPGARIPADGQVLGGASHADESMLTGESLPVAKKPGDTVIGGTMNLGGVLQVQYGLSPPSCMALCCILLVEGGFA